jgi:hypothetical protein
VRSVAEWRGISTHPDDLVFATSERVLTAIRNSGHVRALRWLDGSSVIYPLLSHVFNWRALRLSDEAFEA